MANFAFAGITLAIWLIFKPDGLTYKTVRCILISAQ